MSLQARTAHLQRTGRLPSIVTGLVRDGSLVETGSVGEHVETSYRIGSITKTMTAVLVLQLRDEGLLALDDPVGRFLPGCGYGATTIADLLGHTGGLQSEPTGPWWERSSGVEVDELLRANDGSGAVAAAGDYFHYSNLGYGLLGEVVARLRGAPWWDVVSERLLEPLGLERTTYGPAVPHAQGYSVEHFTGRLQREPHADTVSMAPAGQAWSTLGDLAIWTTVIAGHRPEILAASTAAEMALDRVSAGYGLGVRLIDVRGQAWVGHTGSMPGFLASLFVDPTTGQAVIALANATTGLSCDDVPALLTATDEPPAAPELWRATTLVPVQAREALGLWFWGNTAIEHRWDDGGLEQVQLQSGRPGSRFELRGDDLVGVRGYHRGETLRIVRSAHDPAQVTHLDCATFIHTRLPYDPGSPVPGPSYTIE